MLSYRERRILDFERCWWVFPEPKDRAIREILGLPSATYYRVLRGVIDKPAALSYDPLTVKRLQRKRADAVKNVEYRRPMSRPFD